MITEEIYNQILEKLRKLTPEEFVTLIVEHLERRTDFFNITAGPEKGSDKGVDITTQMHNPTGEPFKVVFQCKKYSSRTLGVAEIDETRRGMNDAKSNIAILVSTRTPTTDARDTIENYAIRGDKIIWEPWCGKKLVNTLIEKTPSIILQRYPEFTEHLNIKSQYELLCPSFEVITPVTKEEHRKADKFFSGKTPTWHDLEAGFDINRSVYVQPGGIREQVLDLLSQHTDLRVVALEGGAGFGKTTLLRRLGYDSVKAGFVVLLLRNDWFFIKVSLSKQLKEVLKSAHTSVLVLIDDEGFQKLHEENLFSPLIKELEDYKSIVVAIAEHPFRLHRLSRRISSLVKGQNYFTFPINRLSPHECELLVDKILEYERDHVLSDLACKLPREERLNLCQDSSDRLLVVAMIQMRHGEPFRNIIRREYERIPTEAGKNAYATVCLFNTFNKTRVSLNLLERCFNIETFDIQEFRDSLEGLFDDMENRFGVNPKHQIIANIVSSYAFSRPEELQAVLQKVLLGIDLSNEADEALFMRIFTGRRAYIWLIKQMNRKVDLMRDFYRRMRDGFGSESSGYFKFIVASQALSEKTLGNYDESRIYWEEALKIDPDFNFALMQYAWLEHNQGNWEIAATRAIKAASLAPQNPKINYQCGLILSLNTVKNFRRAKPYLKTALELEPDNKDIEKAWNNYGEAESLISYIDNLVEENIIPDYALKELRPNFIFFKAYYGSDSKQIRDALKRELRKMQEDIGGTVSDVEEKVVGIEIGDSPVIKALITGNIARALFLGLYHRGEEHDPNRIEQLFKESLHYNDNDPFTHCWYGTFLKEIRNDFRQGRLEYEKAKTLGNKSTRESFNDHPLFLNNIALLIMDEYQQQLKPANSLIEAKNLLEKAVAKVQETNSNFFWAEVSLEYCKQLINESSLNASE